MKAFRKLFDERYRFVRVDTVRGKVLSDKFIVRSAFINRKGIGGTVIQYNFLKRTITYTKTVNHPNTCFPSIGVDIKTVDANQLGIKFRGLLLANGYRISTTPDYRIIRNGITHLVLIDTAGKRSYIRKF